MALNEVLLSERLSVRPLRTCITVDDGKKMTQRGSGIVVCTGSGSTGLCASVEKLHRNDILDVIEELRRTYPTIKLPKNSEIESKLTKMLVHLDKRHQFAPDSPHMYYAVRDALIFERKDDQQFSGNADKIELCSFGWDSVLVADAAFSFNIALGSVITLRTDADEPEHQLKMLNLWSDGRSKA